MAELISSRVVDVDVSELVRLLKMHERRAENLDAVNSRGAEILLLAVEDLFESEGNGEWEPLAEATLRKRRGTGGDKILQDTGVLVQSHQTDHGGDFFAVFTNDPKALPHLDGARRGNWELPQRDFHAVDLDEVQEAFADDLLQELAR